MSFEMNKEKTFYQSYKALKQRVEGSEDDSTGDWPSFIPIKVNECRFWNGYINLNRNYLIACFVFGFSQMQEDF